MSRFIITICLLTLAVAGPADAQTRQVSAIHPVQSFFRDATLDANPYGEGFFNYGSYPYASAITLAAQGSVPVADRFQLGGALGFLEYRFIRRRRIRCCQSR